MRIRGYAYATPCWAELSTGDAGAAVAFYEGLFGWEHAGRAFLRDGLAVAGLASGSGGRPGWLTYLAVERLETVAEDVTGAGGTVLVPPIPVDDLGRLAVFTDPGGAVFGAWQRGTFGGAQLGGEPGAVCWSELATRDEDGAKAFYGKVFGWTARTGEIAEGMPYSEWLEGSRVVAGMVAMGPEYPDAVPAHWRTTVEVADCGSIVERCRQLGGQVLAGPLDVQVGFYAQLLDPTGALLGVIELAPHLRTS